MVVHERFLGRIQSGMDVCDARGSRLGTVARVYRYDHDPAQSTRSPLAVGAHAQDSESFSDNFDEVLEVKRGMLGLGRRLYVPFSSIQEVVSDSVFLSIGGFDSDLEPFKHKPEYLDKLH